MLHLQYNKGDHPCHAETDQHTERKRGKAYRAIRLSDQQRFSRQTEKLDQIAGQLSFFNEAEANCDEDAPEPGIEETAAAASKPSQKPKKKGQRKEDMEKLAPGGEGVSFDAYARTIPSCIRSCETAYTILLQFPCFPIFNRLK